MHRKSFEIEFYLNKIDILGRHPKLREKENIRETYLEKHKSKRLKASERFER